MSNSLTKKWKHLPEHQKGFVYLILMVGLGGPIVWQVESSKRAHVKYSASNGAYTFGESVCEDSACMDQVSGYNWASEHEISDRVDCVGHSKPFDEGCEAWADEFAEYLEDSQNPDPPGW